MSESRQPALQFKVTNVQLLQSGLTPQMRFDSSGGSIGSFRGCDWYLYDSGRTIRSTHCEIVMVDGAYCVKDTCGETYVNGAFMPLGRGRLAKLQHKDEIQIGDYILRLSMLDEDQQQLEAVQLDKMFDSVGDDLLSGEFIDEYKDEEVEPVVVADPLLALEALIEKDLPARSLIDNQIVADSDNAEHISASGLLTSGRGAGRRAVEVTPPSDGEGQLASSMSLKRILGFGSSKSEPKQQNNPETTSGYETKNNAVFKETNNQSEGLVMDDNVLDLLEEEVAKSMVSAPATSVATTSVSRSGNQHNHLLTGPMLNGLGVDFLQDYDVGQMHSLSEELGESLQACIKGLLDLHQQVNSGRFGVMNRNLQPIEDNPLRLGLDYEETLKTMYDSNKSMVHLSAPAAISESLKNIRDHNDAVQQATSEALSQILAAFSPQVLLRRFNNYKRVSDSSNESNEAWAWKMYCSYYQELTSNRQKGFEKLFWEIFEQAYDKKIREKQLEF